MMSNLRSSILLTAVAAITVCLGWSGEATAAKLGIGDPMPDFQLPGTDGKTHSLSDFAGKVVVLNFSSQHCPWSRGADPQISKVAEEYAKKGVVFVGIDSHRQTPLSEITAYVKSTGYAFPVLKDEGNAYADKVGAMRTPELYVVDALGKLAYHGAFDNRTKPQATGSVNHLSNALDALLAGKTIEKPEIAAWGCSIKRALKSTAASQGSGAKY